MKKKFIEEIVIENLEFPNKGIGFFEGKKVVVKNSLVGQKLLLEITKKRKAFSGRVLQVVEKADIEIPPKCEDFGTCGGCTYQNIPYTEEIKIKEKMVLDLFANAEINVTNYMGIEPSSLEEAYRNKMEYSFGDEYKDGPLALGMRKRNSNYEVVTSKNCNIVHEDYHKIITTVLNFFKEHNTPFYHKMLKTGILRHLLVRRTHFTKEILIGIVTTDQIDAPLDQLAENLLALDLEATIKGIVNIQNNSVADIIKADNMVTLYGQPYFTENLLGLQFQISLFSFFQTNSAGAEELYKIVIDFIGNIQNKTVYDLYCGTGTIAQIISKDAKKVYGVEIVAEAIDSAVENASLNNITNCEFIVGDVLKTLDDLTEKPDVIILDPPREGVHSKAISKICQYGVNEIVYVSCKPTSLTEDLKIFMENGYTVNKLKIKDMFPRTYHVESVVLLVKA